MNWFIRKLDWMNKWLSAPCLGLAGLFGALWEKGFADYIHTKFPERTGLYGLLNEYIPWLFIGFFVLGGAFASLRIFTQKSIGKLEKELAAEKETVNLVAGNIETLVNGLLLKLSERIGFQKGESSRITIYIHNSNGHFISFGRYSPDPLYRTKGRDLLPDNQGCISKAWSCDWCYESNLSYKDAKKNYAIDRDAYEPQRMRSLFFAVKRLDGANKKPLAVLVVESKTNDRFPEQQIKSILDNEESYLAEIIDCLKDHIPDPQEATKRGF